MRLSKSVLNNEEVIEVNRILLHDGYLGMGKEVELFEKDIAQFLKISNENVVCVNSGTSALHLAIESILNPGEEILVPSLTFLSSFQAIVSSGAIPIACEVNERDWLLDIDDAKKRITDKTKAIMNVHYASNTSNHDRIYNFAKKHNLRVIDDAAHSFGCSFKDQKIGSFGDIICFSFDGIKNITSGEGGAIISRDKKVLDFCKDSRLLGIIKDTEKRFLGQRSWDFEVNHRGFRYHMSNIFAAIGRVQLKKLEHDFAPKRKLLVDEYKKLLTNRFISFQYISEECDTVPHIFPVRVIKYRNELKDILEKNSIPTGIHYKPNHLLNFFRTNYDLPITEKIYSEILTLPLHPELKISDVQYICIIINDFLSNK